MYKDGQWLIAVKAHSFNWRQGVNLRGFSTPLFLLKKGKNIKFEKGQIFKAFVDKYTDI